ncbi:AraC-like ligand binding domain-containing protein [Alkalibacterium subtropicum]|uniref:AraC-like ligand binding domain-containing protein n=1 Tax=Alkalibacterium subtropicum TaxID=753702 RepID=A0A1I1EFX8_9LACT|nr:AraC family transcriptional regulator [Alkalibacterium subtropicum]SFB86001.1 AraC-like ligand binding domain-containing protein [Alkalibacterium subtropicum]
MYLFEQYGMEGEEQFNFSSLKDLNFPLHFHRAYEIIIVEKGEMSITIEERNYHLTANEAVFIFPNQLHKLFTPEQSVCRVLIFSPELIGHFFSSYKGSAPEDNRFTVTEIPEKQALSSVYAQKAVLYRYCDKLIRSTTFETIKVSSKRKIIQNVLLYIDNHYQDDCTLKDVTKAIQYDYAYVSKVFYIYTNLTFTTYINRYRLTQATYLLLNTEKSVSDIAQTCGYKTLRTFNRNFKELKNVSPSVFREENKDYGKKT